MTPSVRTVERFELDDDEQTAELAKLVTPNGTRLLVETGDDSARLDPLALESLTWQDDAFFAELTGQPHDEGNETVVGDTPEVQIGNEYATILLQPLETTAGPRLDVRSQKLGYGCRLSPAELAAVARERAGFFSELLRTPLGPESDDQHIV